MTRTIAEWMSRRCCPGESFPRKCCSAPSSPEIASRRATRTRRIITRTTPSSSNSCARHGKDWDFVGCVITNENVTLGDKQRSSTLAAELIASLNPDGVIVSKEGFGNPDADLMMNCSKIEAHGIKTVLLTDEFAGQDGASQSLVDSHPNADAIVSTGNANEVIVLPPMEEVIGDDRVITELAGGSSKCRLPDGSVAIELQALIGSTNQLGFERLSSRFK